MNASTRMNRWLIILIGAQFLFDLFVVFNLWQGAIWRARITEMLVDLGVM